MRNFVLAARKLSAALLHRNYRQALLAHWVAPSIEHNSVLSRLPFDLLVDVGANQGQFSLAALRWRPKSRIVAFEPLDRPSKIYRAIFGNNAAVTLHQVALAPQRGEMTINIASHDDSSSLLPISSLQEENFPGTHRVGGAKIPVAPLTDFIGPGDLGGHALLKLDVQGFELPVLRSAEPLLPLFRWIYAECSFQPLYVGQALAYEVEDYLAARNFRKVQITNMCSTRWTGKPLQADFLFDRIS
jgi:FkbM family methyltransferase